MKKSQQGLLNLSFILMATNLYAADIKSLATVDVYGTKSLSAAQVTSKYSSEIEQIANILQHGSLFDSEVDSTQFADATNKMVTGIKSSGKYAYVGISPIMYPHDPVTHITIDVVDNSDMRRVSYFKPKPTQNIPDTHHLIEFWLKYQNTSFNIITTDKEFPTYKSCPAHHCLYGFEHPLLQEYQHTFDIAERYKSELVEVMRNDQDENRRAAAVYILAHIKYADELVRLITPSIQDSSSLVRNNVMRVIGAALAKNKYLRVPLDKIVSALDFPTTTDRNKALVIIYYLADNPGNIPYIKKHAGVHLAAALKLQQPNNHYFAYLILKKISGKKYSEHNYKAWDNWLKHNNA